MRNLVAVVLIAIPACSAAVTADNVRGAAERAVNLIQSSQKDWFKKQSCSSCHQQALPALAFRDARAHGIAVNETLAHADAAQAFGLYSNLDRAVQYTHIIDPAMDDGYRLIAADAAGVRPSVVTAVYARHVAARQKGDGHWATIDVRPPQSYSFITATAVSLRAIQLYHHPSLAADTDERIARARNWLAAQNPTATEERVYQLLGLMWAGTPAADLKRRAEQLAVTQRDDGGWNAVHGRASDAYSTGQALVALHDAGGLDTSDARWMKGLKFLLDAQQPDGSWHVVSRIMPPVQVSPPYFETGFPYGHDQFVSTMGTCWAVMALSRAPGLPNKSADTPALTEVEPVATEEWADRVLFGSTDDVRGLLEKHFDPNSSTRAGTTALMMAMPDVDKAKLLVDAGANVNARSKTKYSALLVAAQYPNSTPAIRFLLDCKAEVRLPKGAGAPLFNATGLGLATVAGNASAVPLFAAAGDRFDEKFVALGMFPAPTAPVAVQYDDVDTVEALLKTGMPVDFADDDQLTLLDRAVISNRVNAAKLLIARGADVNHVDRFGMTPLQHAASVDFGDADMIALLRKAGAKMDAKTKDGMTALDLARKYAHTNLLASLIP